MYLVNIVYRDFRCEVVKSVSHACFKDLLIVNICHKMAK